MVSITKSDTAGSLVPPVRLSEQQLVDRALTGTSNTINFGCGGGSANRAYLCTKTTGLMTDAGNSTPLARIISLANANLTLLNLSRR